MKNNQLTNILLLGLILSIWTAIVLFSAKAAIPVEAQTIKRQYGLAAMDKTDNLVFDGTGTTVLSASNLQKVLIEAPKSGYRIHTVTTYNSNYANGFVVILEK
jgi:hypothetical protein